MNRPLRTVRVFADLSYFGKPRLMGLLHCQPAARGGIFSFEYDSAWLRQAEALAFDPDLNLVEGPQYPAAERGSFGISLAPAYDMNPSLERNELTLAINEVEATCDVSIAMDASSDYGISKDEADRVVQEVNRAVSSWRTEAASLRIPKAQQEFMAAAFE